ncbi:MAG: hypothetical protein OEZ48_00695 [Candidatus Bathyarchaeota archaeon]|nr:hypothetical protein [Candidatus Bathyarchaeota archaeon]MDH5686374.1 hypothetical protein [Candidatus Bathyarchaeota archaeon]
MRKRTILAVAALVLLAIATILLVWNYVNYLDYLSEIVHETERWAVIEDLNGHHVAVEPTSDDVWNQLVRLNENGTSMWIGGVVEEYGSKWGFRFKPETVAVAEVTAEGLQATIQYIGENLNYWLDLEWAYVDAKVTEIHQ